MWLRDAWRSWQGDPSPHGRVAGHVVPLSPIHAASLAGVCPAVLLVGADDPVRDDVAAYAARLRADGVPVYHHILPGVGHADVLSPDSAIIRAVPASLNRLGLFDSDERNQQ